MKLYTFLALLLMSPLFYAPYALGMDSKKTAENIKTSAEATQLRPLPFGAQASTVDPQYAASLVWEDIKDIKEELAKPFKKRDYFNISLCHMNIKEAIEKNPLTEARKMQTLFNLVSPQLATHRLEVEREKAALEKVGNKRTELMEAALKHRVFRLATKHRIEAVKTINKLKILINDDYEASFENKLMQLALLQRYID